MHIRRAHPFEQEWMINSVRRPSHKEPFLFFWHRGNPSFSPSSSFLSSSPPPTQSPFPRRHSCKRKRGRGRSLKHFASGSFPPSGGGERMQRWRLWGVPTFFIPKKNGEDQREKKKWRWSGSSDLHPGSNETWGGREERGTRKVEKRYQFVRLFFCSWRRRGSFFSLEGQKDSDLVPPVEIHPHFLPAAKPTGHRTVRVVVVVVVVVGGGLLWGHDLRGRPDQRSRSTFLDVQYHLHFPPKIFFGVGSVSPWPDFSSGWDPKGSIKICHSLTKFFFGVGSFI